jgi:hypothetical protein
MKLARAIHFDESDQRIFASPARTGEWCISGGFEFSNWTEGDLAGKARQAFANGWFGLETGGRVTFVAVTTIEQGEIDTLAQLLARHFVTYYGAPDAAAALPVAREEIAHMIELCEDHDPNTRLVSARHSARSHHKTPDWTNSPFTARWTTITENCPGHRCWHSERWVPCHRPWPWRVKPPDNVPALGQDRFMRACFSTWSRADGRTG